MRWTAVLFAALMLSCGTAPDPQPVATVARIPVPNTARTHEIRLSGLVEAVHSARIVVPQLTGQTNRLTLTRLIPNGAQVAEGDVIAEFDPLEQMENARTARSQFEDLTHQVEQKGAQIRAEQEKRRSDLRQGEADLRKAELELSKNPILADIAKQQNQIKATVAGKHVESLQKSHAFRDQVDDAALRILELQRDRQQVALERAESNMDVMQIHAPLAGMVAHSVQYRNGSITHAQEGDQLYRGNGLVSIFDPTEMLVRCSVGEPDRALLEPGVQATVFLDAYPDLALRAHFESASPIATTALGSSIKTFTAVFRLDQSDPRLVPDLSAAVVIQLPESGPVAGAAAPREQGQ